MEIQQPPTNSGFNLSLPFLDVDSASVFGGTVSATGGTKPVVSALMTGRADALDNPIFPSNPIGFASAIAEMYFVVRYTGPVGAAPIDEVPLIISYSGTATVAPNRFMQGVAVFQMSWDQGSVYGEARYDYSGIGNPSVTKSGYSDTIVPVGVENRLFMAANATLGYGVLISDDRPEQSFSVSATMDPFIAFAADFLYADQFSIVISPNLVDSVPEPATSSFFLASLLMLIAFHIRPYLSSKDY